MKLKELFEKIDKSKENESYICIFTFAEEFLDIINGNFKDIDDSENKLKSYYFEIWYSTDTCVGGKIYFLDETPVAISYQSGRKMHEILEWISKECYEKTKTYILSLMEEEEIEIKSINLEEEISIFYKIEFCGRIIPDIHNNKAFYNGEKIELMGYDRKDTIAQKMNIKLPSGEIKEVDIMDIDFKINITE